MLHYYVKGNALFQYLASITSTLSMLTSGMHYGWPSPSLPILEQNTNISISNDEGSWLAVMPLVGAALGSLIVVNIVDVLGRKRIIILATFPFFAAWILVAFSKSVEVLYAARFISGMADGLIFTAVPIYIAEIAEPRIRGMLGSGIVITWIFGTLLINIIGSYMSITTTALISSVVPLLCFITFIWMPESQYYLLMKDNQTEARKSLQKFRGMDNVEKELNQIAVAVDEQTTNTGKFLDIFTDKSNRKSLLICFMLRGTQQLSGTAAITFYTQSIFKEAGTNLKSELATIIYYSVQVVVTILTSGLVDKTGRRPLLILSTTGSAVALLIEGTYFYIQSSTDIDLTGCSIIPLVALIGYVILFSLGLNTIPILMLGELFPTNVKAFAMCLADIYFGILVIVVSKFFQITRDSIGIYFPFYAFAVCCLLGVVCITFFSPETKGKSLEEIQVIMGKVNNKEISANELT